MDITLQKVAFKTQVTWFKLHFNSGEPLEKKDLTEKVTSLDHKMKAEGEFSLSVSWDGQDEPVELKKVTVADLPLD